MIAVSAISQSDYPKLVVIEGDTIILIESYQLKKMNQTFIMLDKCNEINESLKREIDLHEENAGVLSEELSNERKKSGVLSEINTEKDGQIDILTSENKKQEKKIKVLKKTRTLFTIGGTVIGGTIVYLFTLLK